MNTKDYPPPPFTEIDDVGRDAMFLICLLENRDWDAERIAKACKFLVDMDEGIERAAHGIYLRRVEPL